MGQFDRCLGTGGTGLDPPLVLRLFIIEQQQQLATAQDMVMLDTMKSIRIMKLLKKRIIRRKRRRWINPGQTDRWWRNLWSGKLLESEWSSNLRMSREHFMELVEIMRPNLETKCGSFRVDALSVEKKVAMTLYYLKDQGLYRMYRRVTTSGCHYLSYRKLLKQFVHALMRWWALST